jgi:hypothetical protein
VPGLPVGFALFGRRHAAGWIAGALTGYGITAMALWLPVQLHAFSWPALLASWTLCGLLTQFIVGRVLPPEGGSHSDLRVAFTPAASAFRRKSPLVQLPVWTRRDTAALLIVLLVVPLLLWKPFTNIGARDESGGRRYRAYFTADFLWHIALAAELGRFQSPPRNPYLSRRPLHYYWAYFVLPATLAQARIAPSVQSALTVNALCAGLLFVAAIFVFAWCVVPRAGPVAAATLIAVLAASAEGFHVAWGLWREGRPLDALRQLNIDAITSWFLRGLTVDGLPRSLWYTPQHAAACALGLIALIVPAGAAPRRPEIGLMAGLALGLALIFSPFLGGAFSLIYGLTALLVGARSGRNGIGALYSTMPAAVPVLAALGWCVASGTFEGAGGAVAIGISRLAAAAPLAGPALALGPLLFVALPGTVVGRRQFRLEAPTAAVVVGFAMYYFVTLTTEPIWIGWRAGQILLVTLPALAAATLAALADRCHRLVALTIAAVAFGVGLPTTIIDAYNAQDVTNTEMGPGFRWTVVVPPDTQAAVDWIRRNTPRDAVVQMSIGPRGRETWTLVPTFAERRMAAGQPISLLRMPEYGTRAGEADAMFRTTDSAEAALAARRLRIDYVYFDQVEREAFGDAAIAKFDDARFFTRVFASGRAAVYAVR